MSSKYQEWYLRTHKLKLLLWGNSENKFFDIKNKWHVMAAAFLLYVSTTHGIYFSKLSKDYLCPSEYKETLYSKHEVHVLGYVNEKEYKKIDKILSDQLKERKININFIEVMPKDWKQMPFTDQIRYFFYPRIQAYTTYFNGICAFEDFIPNALVHEIKHLMINDIKEKDPRFKEKWERFSDYEYNFPKSEDMNDDILDLSIVAASGFTSNYSKMNFDEDAATICADLDCNVYGMPVLFKDPKFWRLQGKIRLAEEYGLVRKDAIKER